MAEYDRGGCRTVEVPLEGDSAEWLRPPAYRYLVVGYQYEGEFSLGFQLHDDTPAHPDVVSEHVYRSVIQGIRDDLAVDHIRAVTTEETPTVVGVCTVDADREAETERTLRATVELYEDVLAD
jgi:hypothetical protein